MLYGKESKFLTGRVIRKGEEGAEGSTKEP